MELNPTEQQVQDARLARRIATHARKLGAAKPDTMIQRSFTVTSTGLAAESLVLLMHAQDVPYAWHTEVRRLNDHTARGMTAQMIEDDFIRAATDFLKRHANGTAT